MNNSKPVQTDTQSLGDVGETTVQLILRKYKWTADIIKSDFGEDIDCNIFIDNSRTNYHLRCQVKSTTKDSDYVKKLKSGNYSISIDSGILRAWLTSYFPVFLIIYEEDSDSCYWCNPIEQILKRPSKLEKDKPTIQVPKENVFNVHSKDVILEEVKKFYRKFLRLDECIIECRVVPVLMPNYRIIPLHGYSDFIQNDFELVTEFSGDYIELLPSWMSVLKKIDPTNILNSIKLKSSNTALDDFLSTLKHKLNSFEFSLKNNEWVSFIVSPITIQSINSSWSNEITYWTSYSKLKNEIVSDFKYTFEMPDGFLGQVSRRARSWDFFHYVHPSNDIALQFFGSYEITPAIKKLYQIHDSNIKGQLLLWTCNKNEIDQIEELINSHDLAIRIIEDDKAQCLLAITTPVFDPFIGLYSVPMDWDSFENGNVRNKLNQYKLLAKIPGCEYQGEVPGFLAQALNRYSVKKYERVLVTEKEYISGYPLMMEARQIYASRFQMVPLERLKEIEARLKKTRPLELKDYHIEFGLKDDSTWETPIYELLISWTPETFKSSKESYNDIEQSLLNLFNNILPSNEFGSVQLKNTYDILHIAGEIRFENKNGRQCK